MKGIVVSCVNGKCLLDTLLVNDFLTAPPTPHYPSLQLCEYYFNASRNYVSMRGPQPTIELGTGVEWIMDGGYHHWVVTIIHHPI